MFLPPGRDDQVLLAIGDRDESLGVDRGDVAGRDPAVVVEDLGRRLGVVVVPREDRARPHLQLAVVSRAASSTPGRACPTVP